MDDGNLTGAADRFAQAAELSGQQPDVLRRLAWVRLGQGRYEDARGLVENAVQRDRSALNLVTYGTVALSLADATGIGRPSLEKLTAQQQALLQTARTNMIEAQPLLAALDDAELRDQYDVVGAGIDEWLREYGSMLALMQSFVQRAPNDVDRLTELARAQIAAGQRVEASATIDRAFSLGATDATLATHGLFRKPKPTSPIVPFATGLGLAIGVVVLLVALLLAIGQFQTKRTLAWLEQPIGDDFTEESKNRLAYRVIVRMAGVLYALMLPVIVVLGLVVGCGFVLLMLAGRRHCLPRTTESA